MWCNNCASTLRLLLFPLRGGATALAVFIGIYSVAGAVFLFRWASSFFPAYAEAQIYGAVSVIVAVCALVLVLALANGSSTWTSVSLYLQPVVLASCVLRAGVVLFRLQHRMAFIIGL
ncbi:hypothetical protein BJY59DRAFT_715980 [Rhodotorula toruloides]